MWGQIGLSLAIAVLAAVSGSIWLHIRTAKVSIPLSDKVWLRSNQANSAWIGNVGEAAVSTFLASKGWLQVHSKYSDPAGIDAIFVKPARRSVSWRRLFNAHRKPTIQVRVLLLEIKANSSPYDRSQVSIKGFASRLDSLVLHQKSSPEMKQFYAEAASALRAKKRRVVRQFCRIDLTRGEIRFWNLKREEEETPESKRPSFVGQMQLEAIQSLWFVVPKGNGTTWMMPAPLQV